VGYHGTVFAVTLFQNHSLSSTETPSKSFNLVRSAWIEGCENEFDLLIVDENAKSLNFTGAYAKNQVHFLIEVKAAGVFLQA